MANVTIAVTLTRPNNTTAYTANGVALANATSGAVAMQIPGFALSAGGTAALVGISCSTNVAGCQYTLRLHFYNAAPNAPIGDNATFNMLTVDDPHRHGWFDLPGFTTRGGGSTTAATSVDATQIMKLLQSDGSNNVSVEVEIINAFNTPASPTANQTFKFLFEVAQ